MSPEALLVAVLVLRTESFALLAALARQPFGGFVAGKGHTRTGVTPLRAVLAEAVGAIVLLPVRPVQVGLLRLHRETTLGHDSRVKVKVSAVIFHIQFFDRFVLGGQTTGGGALGLFVETNAGSTVLPPSVSIATQFAVWQLSTTEDGTTVARSAHIPINHSRNEAGFAFGGYAHAGVAHALGLGATEFDEGLGAIYCVDGLVVLSGGDDVWSQVIIRLRYTPFALVLLGSSISGIYGGQGVCSFRGERVFNRGICDQFIVLER